MRPSTRSGFAGSSDFVTRIICALLAIAGVPAFVDTVVRHVRMGALPGVGEAIQTLVALWSFYVFGRYAIRGSEYTEHGVMSEPSERVRMLASRAGSKVEAIKAYREETGIDIRRAVAMVERLSSHR